MRDYDALTGQRFGRWTVLRFAGMRRSTAKKSAAYVEVRCVCGEVGTRKLSELTAGKSHGCRTCANVETARRQSGSTHPNWTGGRRISGRYLGVLKRNAKTRGIEFKLSTKDLDDLWDAQQGCCALTGVALLAPLSPETSPETHGCQGSLDRVDSSKPYVRDNVQWVAATINLMKRDLPPDEFMAWARRVTEHPDRSTTKEQAA